MKIQFDTASVKVMRSFDYCHFEVALSATMEPGDPHQVATVDELRKTAMRLADKAVAQYQIAKRRAERKSNLEQSYDAVKAATVRAKAEGDRTPNEMAELKAYEDRMFAASRNYDYEDDWEENP